MSTFKYPYQVRHETINVTTGKVVVTKAHLKIPACPTIHIKVTIKARKV
jgi:hypothetical protein